MYQPLLSRIGKLSALLVIALLSTTQALQAQNGTVTGRITDGQTTQPLSSAQVSIPELGIGALTQQNGRFVLINVPAGTHTVNVQRIGYRPASEAVTVVSGESVNRDFAITEEALALDEIIVTGTPGGTQRRAIGNTVASVSAAEITEQVAITNMQDMLAGRTPGLQFTALPGSVGQGSPIQLRGVGSFTASRNQPLIVVDGVRVSNATNAGPILGEGSSVSVLDDFNPEDIESIEIIKGPAAASLYGTEASAGVIQIITKKGRDGSPEFNVSIRQGINFMQDPAGRLGTMWTCPTDNAPGPSECRNESDLVPYNMYDEANRYIREGYFPWPTENLYSNGLAQGYNIDVRGGSQAINYFVSANYDKDQGAVWYNEDEAFRLRANLGVVFNELFSLNASTGFIDGYTRLEGATVGDGGLWQDLVWSNGYWLDRITPFDYPGNASRAAGNARLGGFQEHLPTDVAEIEATRDYSRFTGSASLNFASPQMTFGGVDAAITSRGVIGVDKGWDANRNLFPVEDGIVPENLTQYLDVWSAQYSETVTGEMTYARPITTNLTFDYALTADLGLTDWLSSATSFGAQYYVDQLDEFTNSGNGFASPLSTTINQLSQAQISTDYEFIENKSLGFFIDERISINDRIFITAGMRFDDNSTFGVDAEALRYPKLSATWVLSEESFWRVNAINALRLRGAWGKAGRQPSALSGLNIYQPIPGPGGSSAIRISSPGNPSIEPEVSTELELGFDIAFLDDRVSGEFTHYWKKNENQLLSIGIPSSFGIPGSVDQNLGRIDNWGWEAQLSTRLYESDAVSFGIDLGADHTDNEIKDLGSYPGSTATGILVGLPFPNILISDWVTSADFDPAATGGIATAWGERIAAMCDSGINLAPEGAPTSQYGTLPGGTPMPCEDIVDRNIYVGRGFATNTFSVAPTLGLLGNQLQLFAMAEGQYGRTNLDNGHAWGHIYNNSIPSRLEIDPVWVASDRLNGTGNDFGKSIYNADFWKLREVGARYSLPTSIVQRTGASRASLAMSARNIWTIWQATSDIEGHPIADPEFGDPTTLGGGGNFYSIPPLSNISATLRVTF